MSSKTTNNNRPYDRVRNAFIDRLEELDLSTVQWAVGMVLARRCNAKTGQCNPSHQSISKCCGAGVASVKRAVAELIRLGLVSVDESSGKAVGRSNFYILHPDAVIEEEVNNTNKHQGNVDNLEPNYSPKPDVIPEGSPTHDEFEDESVLEVPKAPEVSAEEQEFRSTKAKLIRYHQENKTSIDVTDDFVRRVLADEITIDGLAVSDGDF